MSTLVVNYLAMTLRSCSIFAKCTQIQLVLQHLLITPTMETFNKRHSLVQHPELYRRSTVEPEYMGVIGEPTRKKLHGETQIIAKRGMFSRSPFQELDVVKKSTASVHGRVMCAELGLRTNAMYPRVSLSLGQKPNRRRHQRWGDFARRKRRLEASPEWAPKIPREHDCDGSNTLHFPSHADLHDGYNNCSCRSNAQPSPIVHSPPMPPK